VYPCRPQVWISWNDTCKSCWVPNLHILRFQWCSLGIMGHWIVFIIYPHDGMACVFDSLHHTDKHRYMQFCHTRFSKEQNQANHMCAQEVHTYARIKKYQKQCYYITYT
jgi:hypothetical protein